MAAPADFTSGSEFEDYLRVLQITGKAPFEPWSIRGLSPRIVKRLTAADSTGPWQLAKRSADSRWTLAPVAAGVIFNSSYPYGANDGPVWAGRGLTFVARAGFGLTAGPLSLSVAPVAFRASNRPFDLLTTREVADLGFRNASYPTQIDLPQRFGATAYSRVDPGESNVRFDSRFFSAGISTGNEWIGPATEYPFLLGNNAPGFPHLFISTGEPINLWFAKLSSRVMWGKLAQSSYSSVTGSTHFISASEPGTVRLAASAQIVVLPRGIPNLEIGFGRFLHVPYRAGEPSSSFWKKPFKVFFAKNEFAQGDSAGADNQLASVFFRWTLPQSGFELYGERGYEDQLYDFRDLIQDPDHEREYMLGLQKIVRQTPGTIDVLKTEIINYQLPNIARVRLEGFVYLHSTLRQGHTNRGQLLGAYPGPGVGAASTTSWSRYSAAGRSAFTFRRIVRAQSGDYLGNGIINPRGSDVIIAAGFERMRFGKRIDHGTKVEAMQDFNRNFERDAPNLNVQLTARLHR